MSKNPSGLGRGFASLIPQDFDESILLDESDKILKLPLNKLAANPDQPRQHFDDEALGELASSIKQHGILQPLVVTKHGEVYQIVAGERRWRAAKLAKLKTVPAIVRSLKELEQLELALIENVQRVDLSPLEQAVSIEKLRNQFNMTYDAIGKRLGKSIPAISNTARLLTLPEPIRQALAQRQISEGHARAILLLQKFPKQQLELLKNVVDKKWSVRQAERFAATIKAGVQDRQVTKSRVEMDTPETKALSKHLGTTVKLRRTAKGGQLEIKFASDDQLQEIISLLKRK